MTRNIKTTFSAAALTVAMIGTSALAQSYPSDFAALDTDSNGQVSFAEYSKAVSANGVSKTAAAQQFTRISAGDPMITEEELNLALAFVDQPYALQAISQSGDQISYTATEAAAMEPPVEVQEAPVQAAEPYVVEETAEPIISDNPDAVIEDTAPEIDVVTEPVPEPITPMESSTEPDIITEIPELETSDIEVPEPELKPLEEELEPQPEG